MTKGFIFESCFAPYIELLISEKRQAGYLYESAAYILKNFDSFCVQHEIKDAVITRELAWQWGALRKTESRVYQASRISVVRQLALYMQAYGITCYVPRNFSCKSSSIAYVLNDQEIVAFFEQVDAYRPKIDVEVFNRLAIEYKILFRMIFCCGLRISEARKLKVSKVDMDKGILTICQSKGENDRIVYMTDDLRILCIDYRDFLQTRSNIISEWFFPARDPCKKLEVASINLKFREFWEKTAYAKDSANHPTVHSLRHSYVVKRMNTWMTEGVSLDTMMPYLSKYLGHSSVNDTFYYYHQVESTFRIIRERDSSSSVVIPEVSDHEK